MPNSKITAASTSHHSQPLAAPIIRASRQPDTAIVYCEANFGGLDGKTANGLVRHSEKYKILAVIDSTLSPVSAYGTDLRL